MVEIIWNSNFSSLKSFIETELYWITDLPPMANFELQPPSCIVLTKTIWPAKPKIFTLLSFAENVYQPLHYIIFWPSPSHSLKASYFIMHLIQPKWNIIKQDKSNHLYWILWDNPYFKYFAMLPIYHIHYAESMWHMAYKRQAPIPRDLHALHACLGVKMELYTNKHFQMKLLWNNVRERKNHTLKLCCSRRPKWTFTRRFSVAFDSEANSSAPKIIARLKMKQQLPYFSLYLQKR